MLLTAGSPPRESVLAHDHISRAFGKKLTVNPPRASADHDARMLPESKSMFSSLYALAASKKLTG